MKKLQRIVSAVEEDERLSTAIDELEDDFDYIISGLEKLGRSGAEASNQALVISENLESTLQDVIARIADVVSE